MNQVLYTQFSCEMNEKDLKDQQNLGLAVASLVSITILMSLYCICRSKRDLLKKSDEELGRQDVSVSDFAFWFDPSKLYEHKSQPEKDLYPFKERLALVLTEKLKGIKSVELPEDFEVQDIIFPPIWDLFNVTLKRGEAYRLAD